MMDYHGICAALEQETPNFEHGSSQPSKLNVSVGR